MENAQNLAESTPEYREGRTAYLNELCIEECPYRKGPPFNNQRYYWLRGFYSLKYAG